VRPVANRSVKVAKVTAQTLRSMGPDRVPAPRGDILLVVERHPIPSDILALADERSRARQARDWARADALKARIEAAGWRVVDSGSSSRLSPALAPDIEDDGRHCHGSPDSVPSREAEPDEPGATVVVAAFPPLGSPGAALAALRLHAPPGTGTLVVAPRTVDPREVADASQVLWTATPFTAGAALRAALRTVTSEHVVVLDPQLVPGGDVVTPLRDALRDPSVAIAGATGLASADLWHFQPADGDVTVVAEGCYAFRRREALEREPLDDRLALPRSVATWLSLLLRDAEAAAPARRAVTLPLALGDHPDHPDLGGTARSRRARRDAYRIADHFRDRPWLAAIADEVVAGLPGDGPYDEEPNEDGHEDRHARGLA
jgi:hypothetical protein